ncbi:TonB-dependent receptor plug domain-containing protein [Marivirga arenosa]|uniref:TonB-dependent receptor plug domain-containing protein n=1 Tax=Marivirga arenosa TaxID=3059076 RepID=A0AA51N728_9BACT|nr:TonB-dependent receptor plug domain-containing protein [Marivirga sp. ABR2-2]WMN07213.1 TonB-dependent receptor plug domain-containing protein [Marivirga sp. ABR2-2]
MKKVAFLYLFFSFSFVNAQTVYKQALDKFISQSQQEKVYLHFDKPQYGASESVWFKAYVTNAVSHLPTNVSSTLYVELISEEKIIVDSLALLIEGGTAHGSFDLKPNLKSGNYKIRAYTQWMRNLDQEFFYEHYFPVINPLITSDISNTESQKKQKNKIIADFFPEGGDFIDQIPSKVAIKISRENLLDLQVEGVIIDDLGEEITEFESDVLGYGLSFIVPKYGKSYFALIEGDTFKLPSVKKAGAAIKIIHYPNSAGLHVGVQANRLDLKEGTLVVHKRGQLLISKKCMDSSSMVVKIDKSELGTGIVHFTFFDRNQVPLSERLLFANPNLFDPQIEISTDQKTYKKRSEVNIEIVANNDSVRTASLTINPLEESSYDKNGENIKNYFLLNSDLKGKIESPEYYFTGTKKAYASLDLLMLSHGWSRFNWDILLDSIDYSPQFMPEKGLKIGGQVSDSKKGKISTDLSITVTIPAIGLMTDTLLLTSDDGSFQVSDLVLMDSTMVFVQVYKEKNGRIMKYKDAKVEQQYCKRPEINAFSVHNNGANRKYIDKVKKLNQISEAYFLQDQTIMLEEVVARGNRLEESSLGINTIYEKPSSRIMLDSVGVVQGFTVFDYLRRVPGVFVVGRPRGELVIIRGLNSFRSEKGAAFFLDNIPVDVDVINSIQIEDVLLIDVLKGADAAIYGTRGATGVVAIFTRRGKQVYPNRETKSDGLSVFLNPGYHKSKEFYQPNYSIVEEQHGVPDYRTTLHWNPDLTFEDSIASETFFSSDQSGYYVVRVEGMLTNGTPFFKEHLIAIE